MSRYYDPVVGRFISPDSVDYLEPQSLLGMNLYAYCNNNPVMYADPSGNLPQEAFWLTAVTLLAASIIATVITGGAAAGTIAATVHTIAMGTITSGLISAGIGTITGGLSYQNGIVKWNWADAADGFSWGAISGGLAGGIGSFFSTVGKGLQTIGRFGKLKYAAIQGGINSFTSGAITSVQGIISNNFDTYNILTSMTFGFIAGGLGTTSLGLGKRSIFLGIGLSIAEGSITEISDLIQNYRNNNFIFSKI